MTHGLTSVEDPALNYDPRDSRRIEVLFAVAIEAAKNSQIGRIIELSRKGARLEVSGSLPVGEKIVLRRAGVELEARITWRKGPQAGAAFIVPLEEMSFLRLRRYPAAAA
jgi:hypothetical protein